MVESFVVQVHAGMWCKTLVPVANSTSDGEPCGDLSLLKLPLLRRMSYFAVLQVTCTSGSFVILGTVLIYILLLSRFSLGDTNLVLREFEKCGVILKHILGPRDANWVHILYQSQYDARKALAKDGLQLNNVLIIGVKTVDPQQKQYLNQRFENNLNRGFIVPLPSESGGMNSSATSLIAPTSQNYFKQNIINSAASSETGQRAIATPTKSVLSKVMDLMFSI
ncbi:nuclear pore complex protein NUP35-like [Curcuma longa]|uniref:nuclear pore complex protein NUP35-like n=1 Tax=Curcuma longa TaxID=136217 RepID=UPI003D9F8656